ncbi:transmembrane sensor [Chitinophaga sp. W3I9]|uniref:FecR family protein n=1 Tax=Chitinophaga sp. W3I9 TaxID=3373924 RepID=UPI003D1A2B94
MSELTEQQIREMLEHYRLGEATPEELALLESWYLSYREEGAAAPDMIARLAAVDQVWERLENEYRPVKRLFGWRRNLVAAAAVAAFMIGIGAYFLYRPAHTPAISVNQLAESKNDIPPATNKATLSVAGSGTMVLDSSRTGIVVNSGDVRYDDNTKLKGDAALSDGIRMLTLQTPKGGTYRLVLPDSSVVWLNAASRLVFPSSFGGQQQREVELQGEGYFEVAKNKAQPFVVKSRGQKVEVLGTHFNISSYTDESITKTTLLEGSIRIGNVVLKPGEQAQKSDAGIKTILVDTEEAIGWKNNYIVFQDEKIQSIMRKISRWYDMEVVYEGTLPTDDFGGRVSSRAYVSQVLRKLELTNKVHFKIVGRTIIVTK